MCPRLAMDDRKYVSLASVVFFTKLFSWHPGSVVASQTYNLTLCQFVRPRFFSTLLSAFRNHIRYVLFLSSKKEVLRVYARRIVALMENLHTGRYFTITKNPRSPIGENRLSFACRYGPVTAAILAPCPLPAISRPVHLIREPSRERDRESIHSKNGIRVNRNLLVFYLAKLRLAVTFFLHNSVCLICATLSDAQTSRGQFGYSLNR